MKLMIMLFMFIVGFFNIQSTAQEPIQTICVEFPEIDYIPLDSLQLSVPVGDTLLSVEVDLEYRVTPDYSEYSIHELRFAEDLKADLVEEVLENTLAMIVINNPANFDYGDWRLKLPACWVAIMDILSSLQECVDVQRCMTYTLTVAASEKCEDVLVYTNFRETEYDMCRSIFPDNACEGVSVSVKRALSRTTSSEQ